jgi:hypothetical protein
VELASLVADSLLPSAESTEVLGCLRHDIREELEGDSASILTANFQIEKHFGVLHRRGGTNV